MPTPGSRPSKLEKKIADFRAELASTVVQERPEQPVVATDARGNLVAFTGQVKRCPTVGGSGEASPWPVGSVFNRGRKSL